MQNRSRTRMITFTGLFAALSTILMFFEFPLPFLPPFLKIDFSSVPILIGSFLFGPLAAVAMAFVKSFVHFFSTTTGGVGELADFLVTSAFAATAGGIYRRNRTKKGAYLACLVGIGAIVVAGALANHFILIPAFSQVMPLEAIWEACRTLNPLITGEQSYILFGVVPFNLIKGVLITAVTLLVYKKLSGFIKSVITT